MATIDSNVAKTIQQFYVAYFNRPADVGGLNFWAAEFARLGDAAPAKISAEFAKQAEYTAVYGQKTSYEAVNQVYNNLFGRDAEPSGLAFWGLALDQKTITIDEIVIRIAAGAQGTDATAYNNKVIGAGLFTAQLDSSANILAYSGSAAALVAKSYISAITDDASLANNTTPAALSTTITNLVAAHDSTSNTPQTFTLTTNFDAFGPTTANQLKGTDTFIANDASLSGNTPTLNAFDSLDGGAGIDTLKVTSAGTLNISSAVVVKNIENAEIQGGYSITGDLSGWTGLTKLTANANSSVNLTAAATTGVTLAQAVSGGNSTTVAGGSTVNVAVTGTTTGAIAISKGAGALTFTHSGGGATAGATTKIDSTTGNVTSTETGTTSVVRTEGALTISKTTGNVVASRSGTGGGDITVTGTTGSVTVSNAGSSDRGDITVTGGTTINITQTATNAVDTAFQNGMVTVNGSAATTAVTVNNALAATKSATVAGVSLDGVAIIDVNYGTNSSATGTITSATVSGFTTLGFAGTALATLSVAGGTGNIIIDNTPNVDTNVTPNVTAATAKTLGLTINGQTAGTLDDADIYTTLNVTTAGTKDSTLSNITFGAATALTVAGTKGLTLTSAAGLSALKTVVVSGSAGVSGDFSGATVTSVDTTATTGASSVTVNGGKATFAGGAGVDKVTVVTASTKTVSLGAGNDTLTLGTVTPTVALGGGDGTDTLSIGAAAAVTASANPTFAGLVTGFESLILTTVTGTQDVNVAVLGGFNNVSVDSATAVAGAALTLTGLPTGGTLNLAKSDATFTANIVNTAFAAGASDTINLALSDSDGTVRNFGTVNAANVENFVITTSDGKTGADGTNPDAISLGTSTGKSITVSGTGGLDLTSTSTALTNVDASGITLGGFTWTSGALAGNVIVKGSVSGTNTVNLAADVAGTVGYTGGTGFDTVTLGASSKAHTINLGSGTTNNTVVGGSANGIVTVTSTAGTTSSVGVDTGTDTVTLGNGANIVSLGNGANIFTAGSGANTYTGGAGVDTVTVGAGANILTLGAGADVVTFSAAPAGVNSYSTITDAHKGMSIAVANLGTETIGTKISLASTAVFQDYANAVIAQGGNASVNGHWGYFTFTQTVNGVASTDTYLVQSRHDGTATTNPAFIAGTDFIVKLTGVVDLSAATGGDSNIIVLG